MNHIDIKPLIDAVKNIESQQMQAVLKSCGGKHAFDPNCPPAVEFYGGNGPASADVKEIRLSDDGKTIIVEVWDNAYGGTFEITPDDIYPGHLVGLIDFM